MADDLGLYPSKRARALAQAVVDLKPDDPDFLRSLAVAQNTALSLLGRNPGRATGATGEKIRAAATKARVANAVIIHQQIRPILDRLMVEHPDWTIADLSKELNRLKVPAPRGGTWGYTTVKMIMARPSDWRG